MPGGEIRDESRRPIRITLAHAGYFLSAMRNALLLPACGEKVGMRGPFGRAQNRGGAPSPAALRVATSPRTRGEVSACGSCAWRAFFRKAQRAKHLIHRHKFKSFDFAAAMTITAPSRSS